MEPEHAGCFRCDWPAPSHVRTLLTTRSGGVSLPPFDSFNLADHVGDDSTAVARNRASLSRLLPAPPHWLRQVHGAAVTQADCGSLGEAGAVQADACIAHMRTRVCAVLVADCLPVLLCDRDGSAVAAAHAGWRGLSAGVLEATVTAMKRSARNLLAYLGPAIGPQAFEVGEDVRRAFAADGAEALSCFTPSSSVRAELPKWHADLFALARLRLRRLGVERIYGGGQCTQGQPARFFSYRRDGRTGRQAALIWIE